jgi:hypothetical protein
MQLEERITAFVKLGDFIRQFSNDHVTQNDTVPHNALFFDGFKHQLKLAETHNGWFTATQIKFTLASWAKALTLDNLNTWVAPYAIHPATPKQVAIIMAGNIPLVGFHDFLCVLLAGHHVLVKQSSNDKHLLPFLAKYLEYVAPEFKGSIQFTDNTMEGFDAVIATGSNNTARYFEYYFKNKPAIIRANRNSVAVLTGQETIEDLKRLSEDIFRYYGLGCRNVSKLFVPRGYDFNTFFEAIYHWHPIINEAKYANNYDYNKAVYLMSEFDMLENGFFIIKEDKSYASPIATAFYEYYDDTESLKTQLNADKDRIQCVVSQNFTTGEIPFGEAQQPKLWDYADGKDTLHFLSSL